MKSTFYIFCFFAIISIVFFSCSTNNTQLPVAPKGKKFVDISKSGMNLYVAVPDSTFGILDTLFDSSSKVILKVGESFQVIVEEKETTTKQMKEEINNTTSDIELVKNLLVDNDTSLIWETSIGEISKHHFYYILKAEGRSFTFCSPNDVIFSKKQIEEMLEASRASVVKGIK